MELGDQLHEVERGVRRLKGFVREAAPQHGHRAAGREHDPRGERDGHREVRARALQRGEPQRRAAAGGREVSADVDALGRPEARPREQVRRNREPREHADAAVHGQRALEGHAEQVVPHAAARHGQQREAEEQAAGVAERLQEGRRLRDARRERRALVGRPAPEPVAEQRREAREQQQLADARRAEVEGLRRAAAVTEIGMPPASSMTNST